jgi:ribosomal protein S18 acetylase RimI-like enzyme
VLVATAAEQVVGFVAVAPAADPDTRPKPDGEIVVLVVDPAAEGDGHGSRLLNAAADLLRQNGFVRVRVWVPSTDRARKRFLAGAGLRADGASRVLTNGDDEVGDRPQTLDRSDDEDLAVPAAAVAAPAESVREERWSAALSDAD